MRPSNYRIVQAEQGYSIFKVYYDSSGRIVSRDDKPVVECFAADACGVTDWLEAVSLAAEKPSISLEQMLEAEREVKAALEMQEQAKD